MLAFALAPLGACRDKGSSSSSNQPAPEGKAEIPASLSIPVEIDGQPAAPIDAALLEAHDPEYREGDRMAWRLASLLGDAYLRDGAELEITAKDGVKRVFGDLRKPAGGREPVLALNRRGEVLIALMKPDDPFPPFHGRGGNRGRAPEEETRVRDVTKIRLTVAGGAAADGGNGPKQGGKGGKGQVVPSTADVDLAIVVDGKPAATWHRAELAKLAAIAMKNEANGADTREAHGLRELAASVAGAKGRVTEIVGADGAVLPITADAWRDAARTPVIRVNRRAMLKVQWIDAGAKPLDGADLRDVHELRFATK